MKTTREIEMFVKGICSVYGMAGENAGAKSEKAARMDASSEFLRNLKLIYGVHVAA